MRCDSCYSEIFQGVPYTHDPDTDAFNHTNVNRCVHALGLEKLWLEDRVKELEAQVAALIDLTRPWAPAPPNSESEPTPFGPP